MTDPITVICDLCGRALVVASDAYDTTCIHCGMGLSIVHWHGVALTEPFIPTPGRVLPDGWEEWHQSNGKGKPNAPKS